MMAFAGSGRELARRVRLRNRVVTAPAFSRFSFWAGPVRPQARRHAYRTDGLLAPGIGVENSCRTSYRLPGLRGRACLLIQSSSSCLQ